MILSIVVAASDNGAIGKDNQLLWHLPADLKYFKTATMGKPIIMGRRTFESIGRPLPGRTSIIITSDRSYTFEGCIVAHSLDEAVEAARKTGAEEACIIGGGQVYRQALALSDVIHLTKVHTVISDADTFFEFPAESWELVSEEKHLKDEKNLYDYTFQLFKRKITEYLD